MLLSSDPSPVSWSPALVVMESQISSCLQQLAEEPRVTGEDGGVDRSAPVIAAAEGEKHHTADKSRFYCLDNKIPVWIRSVFQESKQSVIVLIRIGSVLKKQLGHRGEAQQRHAEKRRLAQMIHTVYVHT